MDIHIYFKFCFCILDNTAHETSKNLRALHSVAQLVGPSSPTPKGWGFDSQSGHVPRLKVPSPVGVNTGSNQSMFLSHIDVSLSH